MSSKSKRPRDASATREAILAAAQRVFTEKGFDGAGLREIATEAGVNAALVNRYFTSKEGLFAEAVIPYMNLDSLLEGDCATFGKRAATYFCTKSYDGQHFDPTLAFLRSMGSPDVAPLLRVAADTAVIAKIARWLGGRNSKQRAALIAAQLIGLDLMRRVLQTEALSQAHQAKAILYATNSLQALVDDEI
ncbi:MULTISPECIES: TetR/AcrR family transcriptional regulator [unclassified Hyphomicrobium]|uniref:TetR/AcrR family transcriptional regulator n=1 Tax=unclassified Hyphomicrobium TaxID=2619925 RepID=UPI000213D687|nr:MULTISPECIES: TetR/AcrR family transcriptional regulator [unclassified Hyphomicrobium]CCB68122.1 Transcriptional regulator, TetR family [Hyphomicrobium sp. MC1]